MLVNFNLEGLEEKDVREIKYLLQEINDTLEGGIWHTNIKEGAITGILSDSLYNTKIGTEALHSNTTGYENIALGYRTLYSNISGYNNTATGYQALFNNTQAYDNVAIGHTALYSNLTGRYNTAIGCQALYFNTSSNNVACGSLALYKNTDGYRNTACGRESLYSNTTGYFNNAYGSWALYSNTTGIYNIAYGAGAMYKNTTGNYNTVYGIYALYDNTAGEFNTAYGSWALYKVTGSGNVGIGYCAGLYETGSNAFYVNNQDRTNTAGDKSKSLLYGVMAATAANQKLTINGLLNQSVSKTPASASATGTAGDICWDASYIYVCTAKNTWKRAWIATW